MIKANCGGLVLDNVTLTVINKIITPVEIDSPTGFVKTNCGGVLFCSDDFKTVNGVVTHKDAQEADVKPMVVRQRGCGGLVVDETYFKFEDGFGLSYERPKEPEPEPPEEDEEEVE